MKTYNNEGFSRRRMAMAAMLGATALASPLTPAFAQDTAPTVDETSIIVTAQRRSEALEDVPMSVAVVQQETLSSLGINTVRDLANVTTGFQMNNSGIVAQPAIRGITTTNAGSYENNVALFVDGLYQTSPAVLTAELPNVENIQILKGPQGTLYGRNATGGAILIDTINPSDVWEGNVEATYGRFHDRRARGYVAGPVADKIGISLAGTIRRTDGYYKEASRTSPGTFDGRFLGLKQDSFRAKAKFDLTDTFRATVGYNYLRSSDPRGVFFTPIENVNNSYTAPGRDSRPRGLGEAAGDAFVFELTQDEGYLNLELDTGIGTIRSITGYTLGETETVYDPNGTYVPDLYLDSVVRDRTWQQSIDFNINAIDNLDLLVGGNYYNIKTTYLPGRANDTYLGPASFTPFTFPNPATTYTPLSAYRRFQEQDFSRTKEAWAIFADATYHFTDELSVNVGGRYSKETQDVAANIINFCADPLAAASRGCTIGTVLSNPVTWANSARSSSYSKFTPRASIRYEIAPRTNVYASYSKGFRGGEWNSTVP
ncbi:MAG: TonB-dependent receptor, partial [Novosphingobium sp.]